MAESSKVDVVVTSVVAGGILGLLVFVGPPLGRCGADPDCIFRLEDLAKRGGMIGVGVGLVGGLLMALMIRNKKDKSD